MLIYNPWLDQFLAWVKEARSSVEIAAPMAQLEVSRKVVDALAGRPSPPRLRVLARLLGDDFLNGAMQPDVFRFLGPRIRVITNLHAKFYLFDRKFAVVTTSNPTLDGMESNIEIGVQVKDPAQVAEIGRTFDRWWDAAREVDAQKLEDLVAKALATQAAQRRSEDARLSRTLKEINALGGGGH